MLDVTLIDGETVAVPSHRPDMTTEQVARDVAHRLKGDVCLWGMLTTDQAIIIPGHQISHILVTPLDTQADQPGAHAAPEADPADPAPEATDTADQATAAEPAPAQATPAETGMAAPVDTASQR